MSFDFGDVITRAARITWKNKVLWLFSALPVLMGIVIFPHCDFSNFLCACVHPWGYYCLPGSNLP